MSAPRTFAARLFAGKTAGIADAAVLLGSPAARFMTGSIVIVDGGYAVP